jgi:predicted HNH restriction endonuclease
LILIDYFIHLYLKYTGKRINYDKYLNSKHWKRTRYKAIKRADFKCSICGTRKDILNVHHNNYNNVLYWEKSSDLICVCSRCHTVIHKFIYKPKEKREAS